jgi:D-threo-aldose 1-dehydrogenase
LFEKGVWKDLKNDAKQNIGYEGILDCWEQGNALLNNYIPQMVSVHDPDEYLGQAANDNEFKVLFRHILEAYKALSELKASGRVKAIGVGAKNWKTIRLIANEVNLDWVMFANSMTIFNHPPDLLEFMLELHKNGTVIINSAVFHAGFLTGGDYFDYVKIKPDSEINKSRFHWREEFFTLCKKYAVIPANACVKFAMTPPGVISISLNTSNPERVRENVASVESKIPAEFWNEMMNKNLIDPDYPYLI